MLLDIDRCYSVLLGTTRYYSVLPGTTRYYSLLLGTTLLNHNTVRTKAPHIEHWLNILNDELMTAVVDEEFIV